MVYSGALTHMSLRCDPRAPIHVPDGILEALPPDPEIVDLEQQRERLKDGVYRYKGLEVEDKIRNLTAKINSAKIKFRNAGSQQNSFALLSRI